MGMFTLLLYSIRLCPAAMDTMIQTFSFKSRFHRYNSLEMYKYGNNPEKTFSGVEFQISP